MVNLLHLHVHMCVNGELNGSWHEKAKYEMHTSIRQKVYSIAYHDMSARQHMSKTENS